MNKGTGEIRSFGLLLQGLEDGQLLADLNDRLHALNLLLMKQAEAVGKAKGEIVLKIKLGADSGGTVQVDSEIKVTEPKAPRARSMMWLTKGGDLSAENPKQVKLPLREVAAPKAPRDVAEGTAE